MIINEKLITIYNLYYSLFRYILKVPFDPFVENIKKEDAFFEYGQKYGGPSPLTSGPGSPLFKP